MMGSDHSMVILESTFPAAAAESGGGSLPAWDCSCSSVNRSTTTSEIIEAPVNLFSKGTSFKWSQFERWLFFYPWTPDLCTFETFSEAAKWTQPGRPTTYYLQSPPWRKDKSLSIYITELPMLKTTTAPDTIRQHCWNHLKIPHHHMVPSLRRESVRLSLPLKMDGTGCSCQFHARHLGHLKLK